MQATVFSVIMRGAHGMCCPQLPCFLSMQHGTQGMSTWRDASGCCYHTTPCSCGMVENKPNPPVLVDAREGRLCVLLACCLVRDMQRRRMGIVRRKRDVTRRMIARCTMPHACCCQALPSGQGEGGACALLAGACRSVLLTRSPLAWPNKPGRHMHMIVNAPCSAQWLPAWSQIGRPPFSGVGQ
jgi:hypothetical protein